MSWSAGVLYDNGRLGNVAIYGLASFEDAIAWMERAMAFSQTELFKKPSYWIKGEPQ